MDEMVEEKLKAMGYKEVPEALRKILDEYKKRQDVVRPCPLSLDAIVTCSMIYELFKPSEGKKGKDE